ncbi:hypothetical protein O181_028414 [Austropuccinia psidii MF-1]|uniref:RNA-directed DNA polymerase n=1 Tax=Austropuccinia psidii MF-1 TaxID=1389203 RepID=A0A9Q3CNV1_9BASI|nr:hypothetical protein [Austropuccinia psidii MF-1]
MSRTTFRGPGEDGEEEEENSVEEEESDGTEAAPAPVGASEGTRGPTLAQSDQPVSHQTEPSLLAIMQSFVSGIGDWGERALIHHFRKGLASHPSKIDSLEDLMDVSLELDTRYHERQKEKNHHQEKKPESSKSNSYHNQNSSRSSHKNNNFHSQKREKPHSSLLNKDFTLKRSEKERRIKEGFCTYCGGKHSIESCFKRTQNKLTQPSGRFPSQGSLSEDHVVFNGLHCFTSRAQLCILNTCVKSALKFFVFSSLSDVFYSILIDSGATHSFIAKQFAHKYSLTMSELPEKIPLIILDSSESPSLFVTHNTKYMVELPSFPSFEWDFLVIDTPKEEDLILGFDFLNHFNPSIDWRKGLIIRTILILLILCILVNNIFQDLLDVYVVVYLDEIIVFSKSEEEHVTHVSTVLSRLRANNLFAKASKCLFHFSSVEYLSYVVSSEGLKMDQAKVHQILNWQPPRNVRALQSFLGFANFYCHFIKNYLKKISLLTSFLKKDSCFPLNEEALKTDASIYALGAVLSQVSDSGKHPTAFNSCKLIPAELNYEIHDKELLGIVWALKRCWAFLLSLSSPFEVLTNHSSLQYFMSSKVITHRQACWAEFHFSITYRPDCLATLPDSLSCRDDIYLERVEDFISKNPMNFQQLIKQNEVQPSRWNLCQI